MHCLEFHLVLGTYTGNNSQFKNVVFMAKLRNSSHILCSIGKKHLITKMTNADYKIKFKLKFLKRQTIEIS